MQKKYAPSVRFFKVALPIVVLVFNTRLSKANTLIDTTIHAVKASKVEETINISGTRFLFPLIEKWATEFKKEYPNISIVVKSGVENKDIDASAAPVKNADKSKANYTVVSRFALVPIANQKNPAINSLQQKGISKADFLKIYFNSDKKETSFNYKVEQEVPIHVYSRGACASATFTNYFGKEIKDLNNVGGKIEDDKVLLESVLKDSLGIAYNNLGFVYDLTTRKQKNGLRVIPIDLNENGKIEKAENFYTTVDELIAALEKSKSDLPPTGNLTFIYNNSKPAVKQFVDWILTKGQQYNHALGFLQTNIGVKQNLVNNKN